MDGNTQDSKCQVKNIAKTGFLNLWTPLATRYGGFYQRVLLGESCVTGWFLFGALNSSPEG